MTKGSGIFTKLHEAEDVLARGKDNKGGDSASVRAMIAECSKSPHYVLDADLHHRLDFMTILKSMVAMRDAGVMRLPYPTVFLELWSGLADVRLFVLVRDVGNAKFSIRTTAWLHDSNQKWLGDIKGLDVEFNNTPPDGSEVFYTDFRGGVSDKPSGHPMTSGSDGFSINFTRSTLDIKVVSQIITALAICVMMKHIMGFETERIEPTRLNKQRIAGGKTRIPSHTVVRIGHIYDKSGNRTSTRDATGRTMPIHMRAAHVRRQHHTTHWLEQEKKQPGDPGVFEDYHMVLIDAVLVNYKDGTDLEKPLPKLVKF